MLGLGLSYGKVLLLLGVTAAAVGPREILIISRTLGRITGRAVGYAQLARGQFEFVMQHSQAPQVHKELQDVLEQLEAIRNEVRRPFMLNAGPMTRSIEKNIGQNSDINGSDGFQKPYRDTEPLGTFSKDCSSSSLHLSDMHSRAAAYAKLAEAAAVKTSSMKSGVNKDFLDERSGLKVLPVCAESAGMLPNRPGNVEGSDLLLEAILEAEVASNAKEFFAQPGNQIKQQ